MIDKTNPVLIYAGCNLEYHLSGATVVLIWFCLLGSWVWFVCFALLLSDEVTFIRVNCISIMFFCLKLKWISFSFLPSF